MNTLRDLKPAEKYTIVRFGEMGFLFSVQLTLIRVDIKPFAQYPESVVLVFRKKCGRAPSGLRFLPNDDFLVYEGWVNVNTEMYVSSSVSPTGMNCKQSLLSFDREYLMIAKRSVGKEPLFEKISPSPNSDTAAILGKRG